MSTAQTVYPCAHCGHPAPEGLHAHHECALQAVARQVAAAMAEPLSRLEVQS